MFIPSLSLISRIIPYQMFTKISHLWRDLVNENSLNGIYFTEDNLINSDVDNVKNEKTSFHSFQLFVSKNIQALLLVEKKINEFYYQITISFEHQEILDFLGLIDHKISLNRDKISDVKNILLTNNQKNIQEENFIFTLMNIITEPLAFQENYLADYSHHQSIEVILRNRIEQERILHQVTQQIQQDLDLLIIVKMTIEQVQSLLQIDRLLIYQIRVPIKQESSEETILIDTVTYEAKASSVIPSVLNFQEESCFNNIKDCEEKYLKGFYLAIDDIHNSNINLCLKELMQKLGVKAKIAIPIIVKNELWGLLIAHQCFAKRKWKSNEINFLKNIAEYLAVAIYQYNSYHQLEEQKILLEEQIEKKAKQLQDALIVAQIANQSKTEFLGSISHELRTPLTCIIGLSGTLLHWSKDIKNNLSLEQQIRYLKIIQDSGRKLLQLINNILDFADIEAGKSLLYMEEISLENLGKMLYLSALEIARNKGINIKLDSTINKSLDLFYCDGERVYQILLNLVDNAIKFTPYGGEVIIKISRNKNQVIFQIEDTGIGINQEQIPLLFTKFQQLENYRTRTHSGTGLGLALSKHLVELHGGIIEVKSIIDKGSTFTVILPNSSQTHNLKSKVSDKEISDLKTNKTIVIICEDDEIGTFLCQLLTAAEYQVIWLVDVYEAINRIKLINPSIVILEQNQEISLEISQNIKLKSEDNLYLMIIRDRISGNEWENLSNSGVDEYLLKPLQPRLLLRKIAKIINH
ncbi:ATP-binding protein [Geminocystis sp. NIES-3709]|uniref:ATP-binding protein n=1 Tax=Geminocystis sp. NIES-3709 TaxID=1617448 RepID=UPI0005FCD1D4|nr:ATP-binding protein [Geminocystis sp. NIES-3709]BAQ63781.1 circadian input kinase A [Geminocystis sp. NIES-3709]